MRAAFNVLMSLEVDHNHHRHQYYFYGRCRPNILQKKSDQQDIKLVWPYSSKRIIWNHDTCDDYIAYIYMYGHGFLGSCRHRRNQFASKF